MTLTRPRNAIVLARISDARNGDERGVTDQIADGRKLARRLRWKIGPDCTHVIVENDTSAFKRRRIVLPDGRVELRTVRPGFRRALDMLASGEADGLIALDLDRACRDPRDLEDLIDVVEAKAVRVPVESVHGSLKLANDADVTMARVLVSVANKSSRDTARRVARARQRQAENGEFGGGRRPFGYGRDGVTVCPSEAAEIVKAADAIVSGVGLNTIVKDLNTRQVPTVGAGRWTTVSLRGILLTPRVAGLVVYQGAIVEGVAAAWPAILDRSQWETVRHFLTDENRRTSPGNQPRWLGSHLYVCGHPDHDPDARPTMVVSTSGGGRGRPYIRSYRCRESAHLSRAVAPVDDHVEAILVEWLARDAAGQLARRPDVDTTALSREANGLRARIAEAGDLWEAGVITAAELKTRRTRLAEKLATVEGRMAQVTRTEPLAGLAGNPDAAEVWVALSVDRRRAVLGLLATVTLLPGRRGAGFDPNTVRIEPLLVV